MTAGVLLAAALCAPQPAAATIVRLETSLGGFNVQLYDAEAPNTVANFLRHVDNNDYTNSIIDTSIPALFIQGGEYACCDPFLGQPFSIQTTADPDITNEFNPARSNVRGNLAMVKVSGNQNSATPGWIFNTGDNSATFDAQDGGLTVFGYVMGSGMDVVDRINTLPTIVQYPFSDLPQFNNYYVLVFRVCRNDDGDGACPGKEDLAVNPNTGIQDGDGNGDGIADKDQPNVTTTLSALGKVVTFATDAGATFEMSGPPLFVDAQAMLATFSPPSDSQVRFNEGLYTLKMNGAAGAGHTVTVFNGTPSHAGRYYAYGPTPDNHSPHWYDFSYDGTTGAEFAGDKIVLHFVDGGRGDDDMTVNGTIAHTGGPATVSSVDTSNSSGCTIATTPSRIASHGDWILVSMFIAFIAVTRRRNRLDRIGTVRR